MVANHAGAITTDTIYKGKMVAHSGVTADDLTATFHNSLTLLSAEIEGRSFGGGVLELVPSEVASLLVPISSEAHRYLPALDAAYRASSNGNDLIQATDSMVGTLIQDLTPEVMDTLRGARLALLERRLVRTRSNFYEG